MSSTQNVKGNRKILLAQYEPSEGVFKIPDGVDLDDLTVVSEYDVFHDTLTINYVNGEKVKIKCDWGTEAGCKPDFVYKTTIENAADFDITYTEDEGDCEECGKKVIDALNGKINALKDTYYEAGYGVDYIKDLLELLRDKEWVRENFPELYKWEIN